MGEWMRRLKGVRKDGTVSGYLFETYYRDATRWEIRKKEDFVRVLVDDGGTDIEIRLNEKGLDEMLRSLRSKGGE